MIKIGMMLGERYEILEKIGTGGMSDVYKSKDHKLNRFIAVKVLKQEFSENNNFVSKFKSEAQSAAGLMHPNIVNVYDVGAEGGIYYIVMELVEGITLKKYIEKKIRLSTKEAISIAIQVSNGIAAAHNNHIIHRDIKPQNIIISKEGKVKVTDFGIAKAATNNTVSSNVMGSVHYTSPEQARGGFSDERSDIYSLGITMFEMLTGRVPFNGDTTVAIAIKHIQEPLPYPSDYADDIPISVEQIVLKCCQKSPDRRYQNMDELIADLKQSLISPDENFVKIVDPDIEGATRTVTDDERANIKSALNNGDDSYNSGIKLRNSADDDYINQNSGVGKSGSTSRNGNRNSRPSDARTSKYDDGRSRRYEDEDNGKYTKNEKITTILVVVAAILVGIILIVLIGSVVGIFGNSDNSTETSKEVYLMPDVIGQNITGVSETLNGLGLTVQIQDEVTSAADANTVIRCSIEAGTEVKPNDTVIITVARRSDGVSVPNVVGLSQAEARSTLEQRGFKVKPVQTESSTVEKGYIISQSPEGDSYAAAGEEIMITVSTGGDTAGDNILVPNVIGKSENDARKLLDDQGFQVTVKEANYEDPGLKGLICYQSVSAGSYAGRGSEIEIHISIGPKESTYKFEGQITAPVEEPHYKNGMSVIVSIKAEDGTQLLSPTTTTTFPMSVSYYGIHSSTGTVTYLFTVTEEESTSTDPETGVTTMQPANTYDKAWDRPLTFTAE